MSSLSLDDIANLLGDESVRPKPKQAGPMRYNTEYKPCTTCGYTCCITIGGHYYCTTHAVYALNQLLIRTNTLNNCTCDVGRKTLHSLHTADCAVYDSL